MQSTNTQKVVQKRLLPTLFSTVSDKQREDAFGDELNLHLEDEQPRQIEFASAEPAETNMIGKMETISFYTSLDKETEHLHHVLVSTQNDLLN